MMNMIKTYIEWFDQDVVSQTGKRVSNELGCQNEGNSDPGREVDFKVECADSQNIRSISSSPAKILVSKTIS